MNSTRKTSTRVEWLLDRPFLDLIPSVRKICNILIFTIIVQNPEIVKFLLTTEILEFGFALIAINEKVIK